VAEVIPVEFKDSPGRAGPHVSLQLAAYALMLEEAGQGAVRRGFIFFLPRRSAKEVSITQRLRRQVVDQLQAMRDMVEREAMPEPPRRRAHCVVCEFRRFCNDV
jgi:CRISPR-associated exonuclease Cas4